MKIFPTKDIAYIALFTALIAGGAFIRIPIPVVPFTLQDMFTVLAGVLLGKKKGTLSVICYIILGLLGVPIFTQGGGLSYVLKPTFGYILGFAAGAYVAGAIANAVTKPTYKRLITACLIGIAVVYAVGMPYFWLIYKIYLNNALDFDWFILHCFLLTLPGDVFLCALAAFLAKRLLPIINNTYAVQIADTIKNTNTQNADDTQITDNCNNDKNSNKF